MSRPVHFCWDIWRAWQLFSGALYFTYFRSGIRVSCFFLFQPRWPHYFFTLALPSRPLFKNIKILSVFVFFKSPKVFSFLRSSGYRNLGLFIGAIVIVRWGEERREAGILRTWRRRSIWTRCRGARIFGISGTPISWAQFKPTLVVSSCSVSLIIGSFSDCFFFFSLFSFWVFVLFVYLLNCSLLCLIACLCFVGVYLQIAALPFGGEYLDLLCISGFLWFRSDFAFILVF